MKKYQKQKKKNLWIQKTKTKWGTKAWKIDFTGQDELAQSKGNSSPPTHTWGDGELYMYACKYLFFWGPQCIFLLLLNT